MAFGLGGLENGMLGGIMLVVGIIALASVVAVLWALYNILTAKNETNWKILWALVVFFLGIIGVIAYVLIGKKERQG